MADWFDDELDDLISKLTGVPKPTNPTLSTQKPLLEQIFGRAYNSAQKFADNVKQASCMRKVPISLNALLLGIGYPSLSPESSITNRAYAFSDAIFGWPEDDRGSAKGSFRHILWQSDMTAEYGDDVARKVGECHEREQPFYSRESVFASIDDADRTVDQLNNVIGRRIGNEFKYLSTKERALKILEYGFYEGFYSVLKRGENFFEIIKEPMSYDEYERKRQQILRLNDNGKTKE